MNIVTQEQMGKLDGLIEKYSDPELIKETVAGETVYMSKSVDVSPLIEMREKFITQEQCENIVAAASNLLKITSKGDFVNFLYKNQHTFYFDIIYFIRPCDLNRFLKERECDMDTAIRTIRNKKDIDLIEIICFMDLSKTVKTYTEIASFYEYIKKYPLTEDSVSKIISTEQKLLSIS